MHNENLTVGAEQVSKDTLKVIYELTQKGFSPEAISCILGLDVQTVIQVINRGDFRMLTSRRKRSNAAEFTNQLFQTIHRVKSLASEFQDSVTRIACYRTSL
jgi:hypothetical protein